MFNFAFFIAPTAWAEPFCNYTSVPFWPRPFLQALHARACTACYRKEESFVMVGGFQKSGLVGGIEEELRK